MVAGRPPLLQPESNFPEDAIRESVQTFPKGTDAAGNASFGQIFTWLLASAADTIPEWGMNWRQRDRELRKFWPTETYLAGAVVNVAFRNAAFDWEIKGPSDKVIAAVTDMLESAIAGDAFGWTSFIKKQSEDLYTQDNGSFIELIRDPGTDANSRFTGENAPVLGIAHLDAGRCIRTGDPKNPIVYYDREEKPHLLTWYQVIPMADFPSSIETMNGIGYCAITRALRMAQLMRSIEIFKDEKISGRHFRSIHVISGVTNQEITDVMARGQEDATNKGQIRFIMPAILASLDPEKPVSSVTLDLASLPDGFELDAEMKWYISGLALSFGVDYQEFAPLPSGNIGSGQQSLILHRKASGKGPAVYMRTISEAFSNFGVLPRGYKLVFKAKNMEEDLDQQTIRKGALEEAAIAVRGGILTPQAARDDLVRRGIYTKETVQDIPADYGLDIVVPDQNPVGQTGGNTIAEDAKRVPTGATSQTAGARLRKSLKGIFRGNQD